MFKYPDVPLRWFATPLNAFNILQTNLNLNAVFFVLDARTQISTRNRCFFGFSFVIVILRNHCVYCSNISRQRHCYRLFGVHQLILCTFFTKKCITLHVVTETHAFIESIPNYLNMNTAKKRRRVKDDTANHMSGNMLLKKILSFEDIKKYSCTCLL